MRWHVKELIAIKKINAVKNFNTGLKLCKPSSANSEHLSIPKSNVSRR